MEELQQAILDNNLVNIEALLNQYIEALLIQGSLYGQPCQESQDYLKFDLSELNKLMTTARKLMVSKTQTTSITHQIPTVPTEETPRSHQCRDADPGHPSATG